MPLSAPPDLLQAALPSRKKSFRGGYRLDRRHPLATGLTNYFLLSESGGNPRDLVAGAFGSLSSGIGWTVSDTGPCLVKTSASATTDYFDTGLYPNASSGTVVFRVNWAVAYNSGTQESIWGAFQSSPTTIAFSFEKYTDNNYYVGWYNTGSARIALAASASNWAQNQWQTYAFTWSSTACNLYRNGVLIGTSAGAVVGAISNSLYLFRRNGSGEGLTTGTKSSDWMLYNRVLSANEVAALDKQTRNGGLPAFVQHPTDATWLNTVSALQLLGQAALTSANNLSATPVTLLFGQASLTDVDVLAAQGVTLISGQANLADADVLSAAGQNIISASASLTSADVLGAAGVGVVSGSAAMVEADVLQGIVSGQVTGQATLAEVGSLSASAVTLVTGGAGLNNVGLLTGAGLLTIPGAAGLINVGVLTASGVLLKVGQAQIVEANRLSGQPPGSASAQMIGVNCLSARGGIRSVPVVRVSAGGQGRVVRAGGFSGSLRRTGF